MHMTALKRTVVAFLVAPLAAAATLVLMTPMSGETDMVAILGLVPLFYLFCAAPLIIIGVPIFLLLAYFNWLNFWSIFSAGIGVAVLATFGLRFPSLPQHQDFELVVTAGAFASFVFWIIWRGRKIEARPADEN